MPGRDEVHPRGPRLIGDHRAWGRRLKEVFEGKVPCDLVIKGAEVLDVFSLEFFEAPVAILDGMIIALEELKAREVFSARGLYLVPGFVDAHIHIESTMVLPHEFARAALKRGTTAVFCDPHEIANVLGPEGIRFFLEATDPLPLDFFTLLPSCVPASPYETPGAVIGPEKLRPFLDHPRVVGLAEVMDVEGALGAREELLEKMGMCSTKAIDGHAPLLRGTPLSHYAALGISSDHETLGLEEALEKVRKGLFLFLREGSAAKNLRDLLPLLAPERADRLALCSDDLSPLDLRDSGHMDRVLRKAVHLGCPPALALRVVTLSPFRHFGFKDRGAVAPGYRADLVLLKDLRDFEVAGVIKDGSWAWREGDYLVDFPSPPALPGSPFRVPPADVLRRQISVLPAGKAVKVIVLREGQITTGQRTLPLPQGAKVVEGSTIGAAKVVVVERKKGTGRVGIGFVEGLGIRDGALGTTVAHDGHQLLVAGMTDDDIIAAIEALRETGGGMVVVRGREVMARLPLEVGGIISKGSFEEVAEGLRALEGAVEALGPKTIPHPFMYLSFLALPVIPELRVTDMGLFDVNKRTFVPLIQ